MRKVGMARILDGKKIAARLNREISDRISSVTEDHEPPLLVSVMVGETHESNAYVRMQQQAASQVGIDFRKVKFPEDIKKADLVFEIESLSDNDKVTSIIIQKPLPHHMDHDLLLCHMHPDKDVEGIHPANLGRILRKEADILPCTPGAVMKILSECKESLYGKEAVVVGHSAIVGKPLSLMLLNEMATTTVCHIATDKSGKLAEHTKRADILVVAVGKAHFLKSQMVKPGATVIDVGINHDNGKLVGDVDFLSVEKIAGSITPVPGGVGPVTVSILMRNVLKAYIREKGCGND